MVRKHIHPPPNCNINLSAMPLACSLTTEYTLLQVLHSVFRAADGTARRQAAEEVMNQAVRAINVTHKTGCGRPGAMTAQIIMVLLHGSLKTWGEFLRRLLALAKRRRMRGYDAAKLTAACNSPSFVYSGLAGVRGKYGRQNRNQIQWAGFMCLVAVGPAYSCGFDNQEFSGRS